ncbi:hypothetical protein QR98_0050840 [Sarcoptes scabiei]|uniref:Uncharacterized protein n=1 Tax=Sarcoptes scabiei TaxID=52283 RepID=A0A132A6P9_SARSC|nr:hypothetical protein QR98_0050840 [Sarcoptes scabiei]
MNENTIINDLNHADSSSCQSVSSDRSVRKNSETGNTSSVESRIQLSLLSKQQKKFANLMLDSFQVILSNPNSTPAEIECMQIIFRRCGKYLEEDNPSRIKSMIFIIRDLLLNYSSHQFINASSNASQNSSISKSLLEIIELASSGWRFNQAQQIYYFPYTKLD